MASMWRRYGGETKPRNVSSEKRQKAGLTSIVGGLLHFKSLVAFAVAPARRSATSRFDFREAARYNDAEVVLGGEPGLPCNPKRSLRG